MVSLPGIDVPALRIAGDPPKPKIASLLAALFFLVLSYFFWTGRDLHWDELQAAYDSPESPPSVAPADLGKLSLRLKSLRLDSGYRLIHPWSGSSLHSLEPSQAARIQELAVAEPQILALEIDAVVQATNCLEREARVIDGMMREGASRLVQDQINDRCRKKAEKQLKREYFRDLGRRRAGAVRDYLSELGDEGFPDSHGIGPVALEAVSGELGLVDREGRWQAGEQNQGLQPAQTPIFLLLVGLLFSGLSVRDLVTEIRSAEKWSERVREAKEKQLSQEAKS